ncbi:hypothetical protein [Duganella sp. Root1480D1]|uniref:hypothetical protein n=1 Tax=Duganella sp. Root1480D1 TaxID=1736471 RepID=UPI00070BFA2F|nr:hypothetical protein [Duganella sp. Root1480D1]KQZ32664.1 hypothetical protein ASD58_08580 [Duganella sp. Root1480D1]
MFRTSAKLLLAAGLYSLACLAQSAPVANYPAFLLEARAIPTQYSEEAVDFEIVVETGAAGDQKTLRMSGQDGMKILLWPGNYYRVMEYGGDSASLEFLSPQEEQDLLMKQSKKKRKRAAR